MPGFPLSNCPTGEQPTRTKRFGEGHFSRALRRWFAEGHNLSRASVAGFGKGMTSVVPYVAEHRQALGAAVGCFIPLHYLPSPGQASFRSIYLLSTPTHRSVPQRLKPPDLASRVARLKPCPSRVSSPPRLLHLPHFLALPDFFPLMDHDGWRFQRPANGRRRFRTLEAYAFRSRLGPLQLQHLLAQDFKSDVNIQKEQLCGCGERSHRNGRAIGLQ
jgi:hypothetical protein